MPYTHYNYSDSVQDLSDRLQYEVMQKYGINTSTSSADQVAKNIKSNHYTFSVGVDALRAMEELRRRHKYGTS